MTAPLRLAAVVVALVVSGSTAEHLASRNAPPPAAPTVAAVPSVETASVSPDASASPAESAPVARVALRARLPMGPVQGPVSSPFGPRVHPVSGRAGHHDGVDLAVPAGTAVWTVAAGTVRAVGRQRGYGLVVEIDHPTGLGQPVVTRYAHLASVDASLRPGARVARGVAIGASGGRPGLDGVSTGAHLHFEVRDASGRPLHPGRFVRLPESVSPAPRWVAIGAPPPAAGGPRAAAADAAPEIGTDPPGADSLATPEDDLPALVLPDYPDLPTLTRTP